MPTTTKKSTTYPEVIWSEFVDEFACNPPVEEELMQMTVRVTVETVASIDNLAKGFHTSRAHVLRWLLEKAVEIVEDGSSLASNSKRGAA